MIGKAKVTISFDVDFSLKGRTENYEVQVEKLKSLLQESLLVIETQDDNLEVVGESVTVENIEIYRTQMVKVDATNGHL